MAIPFLVSIRFLCRACQSRLLGVACWVLPIRSGYSSFPLIREILYELGFRSDVAVWKCNNALRHALQRDAMELYILL